MINNLLKYNLTISKRESVNVIFYSFLIFAFLKPDSLDHIGLMWLNVLCVIIDGLVMLFLVLLLVRRKFKISIASVIILFIYGSIGLFTVFGTQDYFSLLKVTGTSFGFALFTDYLLQRKPQLYFKASITILMLLFSINLITIIKYYPTGMYELDKIVGDLYFMGHDNGMIYNLIPLCSLSMLYSYLRKGRIDSWYTYVSLFLLFFSEIYVESATGIIEGIILLFLILMYENRYINRIISPQVLIPTYIISNILIVVFKIQDYFSWVIVDILGKDLTLTGRTILWDYAIAGIYQNDMLGYGVGTEILGINAHTYPHCHNLILDFLYKGGFLSLFFFLALLFIFLINYKKTKDKYIGKLIMIPLFILLFGEITAACPYKVFFWSFFVVIQYADAMKRRIVARGK